MKLSGWKTRSDVAMVFNSFDCSKLMRDPDPAATAGPAKCARMHGRHAHRPIQSTVAPRIRERRHVAKHFHKGLVVVARGRNLFALQSRVICRHPRLQGSQSLHTLSVRVDDDYIRNDVVCVAVQAAMNPLAKGLVTPQAALHVR